MDFSVFLRNQAIWWFYKIRGCIPTIILKMKSCKINENRWFSWYLSLKWMKIWANWWPKRWKNIENHKIFMILIILVYPLRDLSLKSEQIKAFGVSFARFEIENRMEWMKMKLRFIFGRNLREFNLKKSWVPTHESLKIKWSKRDGKTWKNIENHRFSWFLHILGIFADFHQNRAKW